MSIIPRPGTSREAGIDCVHRSPTTQSNDCGLTRRRRVGTFFSVDVPSTDVVSDVVKPVCSADVTEPAEGVAMLQPLKEREPIFSFPCYKKAVVAAAVSIALGRQTLE